MCSFYIFIYFEPRFNLSISFIFRIWQSLEIFLMKFLEGLKCLLEIKLGNIMIFIDWNRNKVVLIQPKAHLTCLTTLKMLTIISIEYNSQIQKAKHSFIF